MSNDPPTLDLPLGARDVDPFRSGRQEPPETARRSVTQNRGVSASKYRRQPSSTPRDAANADDVDATEDLMKLPSLQAPSDRPPPHPQLEQLPAAHYCVLSLREVSNRLVKKMSAELSTRGVSNSALRSHTGDREALRRAYGAQIVPIRSRQTRETAIGARKKAPTRRCRLWL
jgi:hypothetical protein